MTIHILPHDITYVEAWTFAKERGLVVCLNKAERIAAMPEVLPGWWSLGKLARLTDDVIDSSKFHALTDGE